MIYFLSNHKDISFLQEYFPDEHIEIIPHPYIEPEWKEKEILAKCENIITRAIRVNVLVANGDYFLIGYILLRRRELGKKTGFIAMKKLNEPNNEKDVDGNIIHKNILKPIGIRWL